MINVLLFLINFIDYGINGILISDIILIFLLITVFVKSPNIKLAADKKYLIGYILLILSGVISLLLNYTKAYFDVSNFLFSFVKLNIYLIAIVILPPYIKSKNVNVEKIIRGFFVFSTAAAIFQKVVVTFWGRGYWKIYTFGSSYFNINRDYSMFTNTGMLRVRSVFSEPAHFVTYLSLLFGILLFTRNIKLNKTMHVLYISSILLANSVSGYFLMLAIYAMYFVKLKTIKSILITSISITAFISIATFFVLRNEYIINRIINTFAFKDQSGVFRLFSGFLFLKETPWYGVGVGNIDGYFFSTALSNSLIFSGSGQFYNNIAIAIISLGYIGLIGFLFVHIGCIKKNYKMLILLLLTHFTWGKLFTINIWIIMIFFITLNMKDKKPVNVLHDF
jgi:hypothetical protein